MKSAKILNDIIEILSCWMDWQWRQISKIITQLNIYYNHIIIFKWVFFKLVRRICKAILLTIVITVVYTKSYFK